MWPLWIGPDGVILAASVAAALANPGWLVHSCLGPSICVSTGAPALRGGLGGLLPAFRPCPKPFICAVGISSCGVSLRLKTDEKRPEAVCGRFLSLPALGDFAVLKSLEPPNGDGFLRGILTDAQLYF